MNIIKKLMVVFFGYCFALCAPNVFADQEGECALSSSISATTPPSTVNAMIIYAKDNNDDYPFPSATLRNEIEDRLSGLYSTISYGMHTITFKETTDNGDYFVSDYSASYYHDNYTSVHDGPYGMFNEEILDKVVTEKGTSWFTGVYMIIIVGTDGGLNWYKRDYNAEGYGKLGVDYTVGTKIFGKNQGEGGITIEIGSDFFNPDALYAEEMIHWLFAHEYGHWLRLQHPDGLGGGSRFTGIYSLMNGELHINDRMPTYGPAPLDIFEIVKLGWIDESNSSRVKIIDNGQNTIVTLKQVRSSSGLILARIDIPNYAEQFYFSYHQQSANNYDGAYMGSGLLIWHKKSTASTRDIECAVATGPHGRDHIDDRDDTGGLATDFFNEANQYEFTPLTNPSTETGVKRTSSHTPTGIVITNIQESGDEVTFDVAFEAPEITSFDPNFGHEYSQITINGDKFTGTTEIWFNDTQATNFTVNSDNEISVSVPSAASTGKIKVITPLGINISDNDFIVTTMLIF